MSYRPYPGQYQQPAPQQPQYQPQYPPQYPPQYYRPPRPRRPKSGSAFAGMILAIVVVILLGLTLYMPWWGMKIVEKEDGTTTNFECNLYEAKIAEGGNKTTVKHEGDMKTVFDLTFCFTIISLVLWIVAIISAILVGVGVLRPSIGAIPLAIGLVFAIITPIYFAFALPPTAQQGLEKDIENGVKNLAGGALPAGFQLNVSMRDIDVKAIYGSDLGNLSVTVSYQGYSYTSAEDINMSWAPTYSWYLAIVALVMGAIALGLVVKRPRVGAPYPQYRPAPVQPQYQQYPQPPPYYPPPR